MQPISGLICWIAVRNLAIGLSGRIAYGGRTVPEEELTRIAQCERKWLRWHVVARGFFGLCIGLALGCGSALPLLRLFFDWHSP
jgi:hypothetical protein